MMEPSSHGSPWSLGRSEDRRHWGAAAFGDSNCKVFRNVKDYGAKGDGSTDDTEAINKAISDGNRCSQGCSSSTTTTTTTTPALVYFPPGTYAVSKPIIMLYYTGFGEAWALFRGWWGMKCVSIPWRWRGGWVASSSWPCSATPTTTDIVLKVGLARAARPAAPPPPPRRWCTSLPVPTLSASPLSCSTTLASARLGRCSEGCGG
ncbi:pectate lyase superfamily protein-domain-containing protein [Cercophora newfieldiana]|uniref:Pectate lyase superfamily protein-domain-containing protein n=1 Tax=Cercophora newfieldiana TaxID=92897 RepID=A0AA39YMQ9_9PEZI|nr:pectate lyase superfamily protein-domain-containing protein [Cercophora newfieldiana]